MPTYQYACTECGHTFEQVQSFSEDALTVCPTCSGRLRKVYNAVGVVFKGPGFYRNDSRAASGSEGGSSSSESGSKSESGGSGEKKAETKTETKKDSSSTPSSTPAAKPAATSTGTSS